jgi:hypothetical protein
MTGFFEILKRGFPHRGFRSPPTVYTGVTQETNYKIKGQTHRSAPTLLNVDSRLRGNDTRSIITKKGQDTQVCPYIVECGFPPSRE